ncbi:LysR family transcriptional regulator [Kitasatospora purpeofusca]|uniref:LysR substrate-binding domain-containing protein n=1 Tax=Kitasatospora purpeofusca TaxID=67352 RepID=UPI0022526435|nr:LysR family transcriptional regulator [Kitasatospora purpeofusca]MCX4757039.1 LysR family transcriptional regulator [Kitasatospora purpeofusca]WSR35196.1 LysR family transcriptional regulator [Kitasatospora purpeofusca]
MTTLRQFEYLVTVVDTGSFTRAAELLHVTQPALSHQVRALERALGGPLLERLPRAVRPTPMGRAVLPHARAALADAERLRAAALGAAGLAGGELELATVYSVSLGLLPPVLRAWRAAHPEVRIRLREFAHTEDLRAAMTAGQADVAVGPLPTGWEGPIRELGEEEFVLVLPSEGEDGREGQDDAPVPLAALAGRDWVHYAPGNGLADVLDAACAAAGFRPGVAVRTEQTAAAPLLAAAGLGPALVPANIVPPGFDGLVRRPEPPVRRPLVAYTRSRPDALTTAFVELLARRVRLLPDIAAGGAGGGAAGGAEGGSAGGPAGSADVPTDGFS